jgi:hypothetical protein
MWIPAGCLFDSGSGHLYHPSPRLFIASPKNLLHIFEDTPGSEDSGGGHTCTQYTILLGGKFSRLPVQFRHRSSISGNLLFHRISRRFTAPYSQMEWGREDLWQWPHPHSIQISI